MNVLLYNSLRVFLTVPTVPTHPFYEFYQFVILVRSSLLTVPPPYQRAGLTVPVPQNITGNPFRCSYFCTTALAVSLVRSKLPFGTTLVRCFVPTVPCQLIGQTHQNTFLVRLVRRDIPIEVIRSETLKRYVPLRRPKEGISVRAGIPPALWSRLIVRPLTVPAVPVKKTALMTAFPRVRPSDEGTAR